MFLQQIDFIILDTPLCFNPGRSVPSAVPLDNCRVFSSHWRLKGNLERKTDRESFSGRQTSVPTDGTITGGDLYLKMLKMLTLNSAW